jgi:hypothetical protein
VEEQEQDEMVVLLVDAWACAWVVVVVVPSCDESVR